MLISFCLCAPVYGLTLNRSLPPLSLRDLEAEFLLYRDNTETDGVLAFFSEALCPFFPYTFFFNPLVSCGPGYVLAAWRSGILCCD